VNLSFGDDIVVAPIAAPIDSTNMLARQRIWIPPGEWIEWYTGSVLRGPAVVERTFALDEIPVYVRAGAIIPLQVPAKSSMASPRDPCILAVFPMDTGSTLLYEDAGNSLGYQRGEYATTLIRHSRTGDGNVHVRIEPREGSYPGMRATSRYEIRLELSWPPSRVTVNSESVPHRKNEGEAGWRYDGDNTRVVITTDVQSSSVGRGRGGRVSCEQYRRLA